MPALVPHLPSPTLPAVVEATGDRARLRFLEFFASAIRNPHTRRAYVRAAVALLDWCAAAGVPSLIAVQPLHVATWIEGQTRTHAAPTVKQRLAAIRHLWVRLREKGGKRHEMPCHHNLEGVTSRNGKIVR